MIDIIIGGENVLHIRPVTDLRNKFSDISKLVHEKAEPVFLTKNGYGDMVVMSIETYEKMLMDNIIFEKLREAIIVAESTEERYDFDKVSKEMRDKLIEKLQD
ncbi:MAG: type II toxin-antitoxin system Phd/YefM family antitoxin [Sedimentibacter sp.]|jgi:prevent-host-death family protein